MTGEEYADLERICAAPAANDGTYLDGFDDRMAEPFPPEDEDVVSIRQQSRKAGALDYEPLKAAIGRYATQ